MCNFCMVIWFTVSISWQSDHPKRHSITVLALMILNEYGFTVVLNHYQWLSRYIKMVNHSNFYQHGYIIISLWPWFFSYLAKFNQPPFPQLPLASFTEVNFWKSSLRPTACSRIWTNPCRGRMCLMFGRGNQVSHQLRFRVVKWPCESPTPMKTEQWNTWNFWNSVGNFGWETDG